MDSFMNTGPQLYAVRKGRNVQRCVFFRWEDCQAEIEGGGEYRVFAAMQWQEAFEYVMTTNDNDKKRKAVPVTFTVANRPKKHPKQALPLHQVLLEGFKSSREKGWRCSDLSLSFREPHKKEAQARYMLDLAELKGTLAVGTPILELTPDEKQDLQQKSDHAILTPFSIKYLNYAWGVHRKYHNDLPKSKKTSASSGTTPFTSCTIESRQAALMRYTPKKLFLNQRVQELTQRSKLYQTTDALTCSDRDKLKEYQHKAALEWELLTPNQKQGWELEAARHDELQPTIQPKLISILQKDPQRPTSKLVQDIGYWCGRTTIGKWRLKWEQQKRKRSKKDSS